jgi:hypothetical protein
MYGPQNLNDMFNLGMAQYTGAFSPLFSASSIYGSPTVLGGGGSSSSSNGIFEPISLFG